MKAALGRLGRAIIAGTFLFTAHLDAMAGDIAASAGAAAHLATREPDDGALKAAVATYLRHIYTVYVGIRACAEIGARTNDGSFISEVSLEEARRTLGLIDKASAEIGVDSAAVWNAAAPLATVTAEALKVDPPKHLALCQRMGSLFRTDAANLQANLHALGAHTSLIKKDY